MNKFSLLIKYVCQSTLWVLLFLGIVQPFGIDQLEEGRTLFIICEALLSALATFLSTGLAMLLVPVADEANVPIKRYVTRAVVNLVVFIPLLAAMLLTYNGWYNNNDAGFFWYLDGHFTLYHLGVMSLYVSAVSVFIFIIIIFQQRNSKLKRELDEVKAINALLEKRQERLEEEFEQETETAPVAEEDHEVCQRVPSAKKIVIVGQGQDARIEVDAMSIIYVESMSNYADICYIADNETKHSTLRITLKQIRETLSAFDNIVQCHRAFLVNLNFVVSLARQNPGYQLQLFGMEKQIPVSRANTEAIKKLLEGK